MSRNTNNNTAYTVGPLLLRRLGHTENDAIFEVDAIFEG